MGELPSDIEQLLKGEHSDPFSYLGLHRVREGGKSGMAVRAFLPQAQEVQVVPAGGSGAAQAMRKVHAEGVFEAFFPGIENPFDYHFLLKTSKSANQRVEDPYRFPPILSDFDLYLMAEGNHRELYEKLGAHVLEIEGVRGVLFAVWAPNAKGVSVIGDFNEWDGRRHPMRSRGPSGVWELFVPGVGELAVYKYAIRSGTQPALVLEKADPCGFFGEVRPKSGSVVYNIDRYQWNDEDWIRDRAHRNTLDLPMSVYEIHLGSWKRVPEEGNRFLTYRELAEQLVPYILETGFTHIQLLPVMEHPFDASWGYQTLGHFAPTSRFGTPEDFMYFVDVCHQHGIGVILDWVAAHFPKDGHGLRQFDGTCLYEHADPRQAEHPDWETLIFNYGRNEVRGYLLSNALFWIKKYHVDGLRADAVASMIYLDYSRKAGEWIPNRFGGNENLEAIEFIKTFNELVHQTPGVVAVAEESTAWPGVTRPVYLGGLGFTLKWNMGWMHDMLQYMEKDPIYRKYDHNSLTFSLLYAFHENFVLPLSHDEVVHGKRSLLGKMPGDASQRFANLRLLYGYMYGQPGKKLLFMGGEFGQWKEWDCDHSLDWSLLEYDPHRKLLRFVKDLNRLYRSQPALYEVDHHHSGFEWIDFHDWENSLVSFLRRAKRVEDFLVFACNFTPVARHNYRVGVPDAGYYAELLNSNSEIYGGDNLGNSGGMWAEPAPCHGRPYSLSLMLPPLSVLIFKKT